MRVAGESGNVGATSDDCTSASVLVCNMGALPIAAAAGVVGDLTGVVELDLTSFFTDATVSIIYINNE